MQFWLTVFLGLALAACTTTETPTARTEAEEVLAITRSKLLGTATHGYHYVSFWDNRFANSTYTDSASVRYAYLPDSELGFGFHVSDAEYELFYDGKDQLEIDHVKRKIIRVTASEIGKDSSYFDNLMAFHNDPKHLPGLTELTSIRDTVIRGRSLFVYARSVLSDTNDEPPRQLNTTREYFVDPTRMEITRIRKSTHVDNDTVQIIDDTFTDFTFSDKPYDFGPDDISRSLGYRELSEAANEEERLAGLIKAGDRLHRADYTDINGNVQELYGQGGRKTVVMFSFIGCGGCEYALREMKKKDFALREGVRLFYSSPEDLPAALEKYFEKKAFPFTGFGKDSRMNENFKVAAFPTFVSIDSEGIVQDVIGGYDEKVAEILFD